MEKTSYKLCYILKHGFIAIFAFAGAMALGISSVSRLISVPTQELNTEVLRLETNLFAESAANLPFSMCYLFLGVSAILLLVTLFYIRKICKVKV